jgi:hypothetical protein
VQNPARGAAKLLGPRGEARGSSWRWELAEERARCGGGNSGSTERACASFGDSLLYTTERGRATEAFSLKALTREERSGGGGVVLAAGWPTGARRGSVAMRPSRPRGGRIPPRAIRSGAGARDDAVPSSLDCGSGVRTSRGGGAPATVWRRGHNALSARARSRAPECCFNLVYPIFIEPNSKNSNRSSISPKTRLVEELQENNFRTGRPMF